MVGTKHLSHRITDLAILLVLIIVSIICMIPIVHTVAVSFSDRVAADAGQVGLWPVKFSTASYSTVLEDRLFYNAVKISVIRVMLGVAINLALTILTAYALSKETSQFRMRNVYVWILIFTMLFNGGIVPWFMTIKSLGLLDTIWALVLPGAVPVFNVILLMNFFRNLPKELSEAAEIDGAGPWYIMVRLFVPLSLPSIATVSLFSLVSHWNAFFDGLVLMKEQSHYPLQTYIQTFVAQLSTQALTTMSAEQLEAAMKVSNRTFNAAKIIISMIPVVMIYPFIQRFFIHGITLGSVKE